MDWLLISCIASGVFGLILAFVLGAFHLADRADRQSRRIMRDRLAKANADATFAVLWGDQHPYRGR